MIVKALDSYSLSIYDRRLFDKLPLVLEGISFVHWEVHGFHIYIAEVAGENLKSFVHQVASHGLYRERFYPRFFKRRVREKSDEPTSNE